MQDLQLLLHRHNGDVHWLMPNNTALRWAHKVWTICPSHYAAASCLRVDWLQVIHLTHYVNMASLVASAVLFCGPVCQIWTLKWPLSDIACFECPLCVCVLNRCWTAIATTTTAAAATSLATSNLCWQTTSWRLFIVKKNSALRRATTYLNISENAEKSCNENGQTT